ncbi:MAG: ABC transporter permease [Blastocatellia bacterium]|nr:ABC transporter permease [Blastocatellia bacterium]
METLLKDLRYAVRMMLKRPTVTIIAAFALAAGIGANSAIFSVVNAVLIRPLPYESPDQLVMVWETRRNRGTIRNSVAPLDFYDWRDQNQAFQRVAAFAYSNFNLMAENQPERVLGVRTSADSFETLAVKPFLGRAFSPEEEKLGNNHVVILSHGFWQDRFNSDSTIIGKTMVIDGETHIIVGVLPLDFRFPLDTEDPELWTPLALDEDEMGRGNHFLRVIARLKPGATHDFAQSDMDAITGRLEQQYPDSNANHGAYVAPLHDEIVGDVRPALLLLLGAVGFVLLIACANVANLMLARATARQREVAIRAALGAARFRIVRQFLTESLLLALAGGGLGLLLALWGVDLLIAFGPQDIPRLNEVSLDYRVLGFTLTISLLSGLIFGLVPALQTSKPDLNESLKEGGRSSAVGAGRRRLLNLFVVSEVALALVLLIVSGLLIKSFLRLQDVKPGFDPDNLLTMGISLPESKYAETARQTAFYRELVQRVETVPGVEAAGVIRPLPFSQSNMSLSFSIEGRPPASPGERTSANWRTISPDYFRTMRIPLLKGRAFTERDVQGSPYAIIINETMARLYFSGEDPISRRMTIGYDDITCEIVGIAGDVKLLLDGEQKPEMYTPCQQTPWPSISLVIRTASDRPDVVAAVRNQVQSLDRELPVYSIKTMNERLADSIAQPRFNMLLLGLFAFIAVALATVGIYGVMSYSVSQRTHEMGVRMALGARAGDVLKLVLSQGMKLTLAGIAMGIVGAYGLTRIMSSFLFGVSDKDPTTFAAVSLLLIAVAALACYIPARRATRVDPMVALRYE